MSQFAVSHCCDIRASVVFSDLEHFVHPTRNFALICYDQMIDMVISAMLCMSPCSSDSIFLGTVSRFGVLVSTDSLLSQVASVLSTRDVHRYSQIFFYVSVGKRSSKEGSHLT